MSSPDEHFFFSRAADAKNVGNGNGAAADNSHSDTEGASADAKAKGKKLKARKSGTQEALADLYAQLPSVNRGPVEVRVFSHLFSSINTRRGAMTGVQVVWEQMKFANTIPRRRSADNDSSIR